MDLLICGKCGRKFPLTPDKNFCAFCCTPTQINLYIENQRRLGKKAYNENDYEESDVSLDEFIYRNPDFHEYADEISKWIDEHFIATPFVVYNKVKEEHTYRKIREGVTTSQDVTSQIDIRDVPKTKNAISIADPLSVYNNLFFVFLISGEVVFFLRYYNSDFNNSEFFLIFLYVMFAGAAFCIGQIISHYSGYWIDELKKRRQSDQEYNRWRGELRETERKNKEQELREKRVRENELRELREKNKWNQYRELRKAIEAMPQYEHWRQEVFRRHGKKCSICGSDKDIEVDHRYKSFHQIIRENGITNIIEAYECAVLWDVDNGAPVCKLHHDQTKSSQYYNKSHLE